jgi:hypothetical protein
MTSSFHKDGYSDVRVGGEDEDNDDEDLEAILAKMDIDKDFNNWTSFRKSVSAAGASVCATATIGEEGECWDSTHQARLARIEIYSRHYHPTDEEAQEVKDLGAVLGLSSKSFLGNWFLGGGSNRNGKRSCSSSRPGLEPSSLPSSSSSTALSDRERYESIQDRSVLLLRAFALLEVAEKGYRPDTKKSSARSATGDSVREVEVILLTGGLVVAEVKRRNSTSSKRDILMRSFLACVTWDQVDHVVEGIGQAARTAWKLHFKPKPTPDAGSKGTTSLKVWTFTTASTNERVVWLDALETVLVRTHMHSATSSSRVTRDEDQRHELGWQYHLVHRGGYTAAVTGRLDDLPVPPRSVNAWDQYNGLTMLIYAVRCGNANVVSNLLDRHDADVDATDRDGHSAMYYATRDEQHDMQQILTEYGARPSMEALQCGCGELFGAVQDAQEAVNDRREQEAASAAAAAAHERACVVQDQMNDNVRLMHERGQKIREMGDKAAQLNEGAANYAEMARQLKERSQKPTFFGLL